MQESPAGLAGSGFQPPDAVLVILDEMEEAVEALVVLGVAFGSGCAHLGDVVVEQLQALGEGFVPLGKTPRAFVDGHASPV
jgi:hypothetical protein